MIGKIALAGVLAVALFCSSASAQRFETFTLEANGELVDMRAECPGEWVYQYGRVKTRIAEDNSLGHVTAQGFYLVGVESGRVYRLVGAFTRIGSNADDPIVSDTIRAVC